jgi:hypothetical protein
MLILHHCERRARQPVEEQRIIQVPTDCRVAALVAMRRSDWRSDSPCGRVPDSREKETP